MNTNSQLFALFCLLLHPTSAISQVKNPGVYTYVTISDSDTMDPAYAYDTASHMAMLNVYEPLFQLEGASTSKLIPLVAEKVPSRANGLISPDGKVYTIPIRKGIRFHDGTPLTPEDVRYSLLRFMLMDRDAGPASILLEPLLGYPSTRDAKGNILPNVWKDANRAVALKGDALVLTLPKPYAPLLSILALWAPTVSKAWATKNGDWDGREETWAKFNNPSKESSPFFERGNGTGPFKLERWDRKNKQLDLVRHDGYWRGPAKLARVVVKGVNEFGTRKLMLAAGDADSIYADWQAHSQLKGMAGVRLTEGLKMIDMNPVAFFTFKINAAGNPYVGSGRLDGRGIPPDFFADPDVRKGFAWAFDYEGFIRDVFRGRGTQATGLIPAALPGSDPKAPRYRMDLKKAEEHFRRAKGGKVWETGFRFTLAYNSGNATRQTLCQILKRRIEQINPRFQIDVRPIEWPTFLDSYRASKLPIFVMGWNADYPDAHSFAFPIMHSKGNFPLSQGYANPEADRLVSAAAAETDPAARKRLYAKLLAVAHQDAPHLVMLDTERYRAEREWVRGFVHNPIFPDSPYGGYFYPVEKR